MGKIVWTMSTGKTMEVAKLGEITIGCLTTSNRTTKGSVQAELFLPGTGRSIYYEADWKAGKKRIENETKNWLNKAGLSFSFPAV